MAGGSLALCLLAGSLWGAEQQPATRPNLLLFFPDQHRSDWTSLNPALPDLTPRLKTLAEEGVFFANAICPSPVCAPSRACLASGREYEHCGVRNNGDNYPLSQPTFYSLLRQAGYHVLGCGKFDLAKPAHSWGADGKQRRVGLPSKLDVWGFTDGIDNAGKMDGWWAYQHHWPEPYFTFLEQRHLVPAYAKNYRLLDHDYPGPAVLPDAAYSDNWIARNGLELLRSVPQGAPWFLQVNFNGPHDPMDITKSMYDQWKAARFPAPVAGPNGPQVQKKRRNYGAMVANIDHWVGVYLTELRRRGDLTNTIVVYCSDHGDMLGDHGYWAKTRPLQPSASVPLFMAGPGIRARGRVLAPVETMDLAATFLDYAGVPKPKDMDSRSLRPYLEGDGKLPRALVRSSLGQWTMVFDGQYKLISGQLKGKVAPVDSNKHLVLYDLKHDPGETTDVATEHPEIVARLKPHLAALPHTP